MIYTEVLAAEPAAVVMAPPNKTSLQRDAQSWASRVAGLSIVDGESCINASYFLRSIKGVRADIQGFFKPHIDRAMGVKRQAEEARKALVTEMDTMEAPLVDAELKVKRALLVWEEQQEAARQAEEARRQADAQAEAERLTLEAAAEMEAAGVKYANPEMIQEAHDLLNQPVEAPAVVVKSFAPKVEGVSYRDNWTIHPTVDLRLLAAEVAAGRAPVSYLLPNLPALRAFAKATRGGQDLPGVKVINDRQIAARA